MFNLSLKVFIILQHAGENYTQISLNIIDNSLNKNIYIDVTSKCLQTNSNTSEKF